VATTRQPLSGQRDNLGCPHGTLTVEGELSQGTPCGALDAPGFRDLGHWADLDWKKCLITRHQHPVESATYRWVGWSP
jgi:hypothetical protein